MKRTKIVTYVAAVVWDKGEPHQTWEEVTAEAPKGDMRAARKAIEKVLTEDYVPGWTVERVEEEVPQVTIWSYR